MHTFVQFLITFCSRLEAAGDVISDRFVGPFVLHKRVNIHDPILNASGEIPPEAVEGGISPYNFRADVDNDVMTDPK